MGPWLLAIGVALLLVGGYQVFSLGSQNPPFATPHNLLQQVEAQANLWKLVAGVGLILGVAGFVMMANRRPYKP